MSRLDSFIRRLTAQRACLDQAVGLIGDLDGVVLEVGLGNGRTFDHLRAAMPDREIYVFDRQVASHPASTPADDRIFLGDLSETLTRAAAELPQRAALVHSDIGTGDPEADVRVAEMMAGVLPRLLVPGAVVISDQFIPLPDAEDIPLPQGVPTDRYFFQTYLGRQEPLRRIAGGRRW